MKKILFPTDFSEASKNAFLYALKLADSIKAEIITLHVYDFPKVNYIDVSQYLNEIYEVTELSNFENYKDQVPVLRNIADQNNLEHIKISNVLERGNLIDKIINLTNRDHIDYVVMGTKGATGLKQTFLGTETTKVMNETQAVVLAIPEHCQFQPIEKILFLTQYKEEDLIVLKKIIKLAKVFEAHIDCLYVKGFYEIMNDNEMDDWNKIIKDKDISLHTIQDNDVEGVILNFIESNKINMIAMHIHHKSFFEKLFQISLSKKLAFHINVPILAIKN